ncbi:Phosphoglycolate phosphatase [uncultured archaeon]|nr:Phosphoglycolate phosphatase [uncultured archaeon]
MAKLPRSVKRAMNSERRGVVAFDFDGVIGDTAYECYVQTMKAWADVGGKTKPSAQVEKQFMQARPLITKRDHFFTVMRMIEENPRINFNNLTQGQMNAGFRADATKAKQFDEIYQRHREEMIKNDNARWNRLNRSFPKIAEFIKKVRRGNDIYIASTKTRGSILELLKRYKIDIPASRVLASEDAKDKAQMLKIISERSGKPLNRIMLVEDAIEQVKVARGTGVKAVLYRRGYSTTAQKKEAKRMGVPIVDFTKKFDSRRVNRMVRN